MGRPIPGPTEDPRKHNIAWERHLPSGTTSPSNITAGKNETFLVLGDRVLIFNKENGAAKGEISPSCETKDVGVDENDNRYILCSELNVNGDYDFSVSKYSPDNRLLWKRLANFGNDYPRSIAVNKNGYACAVGKSASLGEHTSGISIALYSSEGSEIHKKLIKLADVYAGAVDAVLGEDNSCYTTGFAYMLNIPDFPMFVWTMKFDPAGNIVWDELYTDWRPSDNIGGCQGAGIAYDKTAAVNKTVVAGACHNSTGNFGVVLEYDPATGEMSNFLEVRGKNGEDFWPTGMVADSNSVNMTCGNKVRHIDMSNPSKVWEVAVGENLDLNRPIETAKLEGIAADQSGALYVYGDQKYGRYNNLLMKLKNLPWEERQFSQLAVTSPLSRLSRP